MKNKVLLWLDDIRNPFIETWLDDYVPEFSGNNGSRLVWVKTYDEFVSYISQNGLPTTIAFDHDLGSGTNNGYDCTKWLVDYLMKTNLDVPDYVIQSANPVGKTNISSLLDNYQKFREGN